MKYISPKIAVSAALVLILCGCARAGGQRNLSPAPGGTGSCRVVDSTVNACIPLNFSANSGQIGEVVACLERSLTRKEGTRDSVLAESARLFFTLGEKANTRGRLAWYDTGRRYAELLCREEPGRVEGYYWLALNLCGICELSGAGHALAMVPTIVKNLELALAIDETYDQGGPLRVLGRIRYKAPPWPLSEGDLKQSLVLLRSAVKIAPDNSSNHLYLAETLIQLGKAEEACMELERALELKSHASSPSEFEEDQEQALALMTQCCSTLGKNAPDKGRNFARAVKETAKNDFPK